MNPLHISIFVITCSVVASLHDVDVARAGGDRHPPASLAADAPQLTVRMAPHALLSSRWSKRGHYEQDGLGQHPDPSAGDTHVNLSFIERESSQSAMVPMVLTVVAVVALVGISVFICMMRQSASAVKSPVAHDTTAGTRMQALSPVAPNVLQRSPAAAGFLSPPAASVSHESPAGYLLQSGTNSRTLPFASLPLPGRRTQETVPPPTHTEASHPSSSERVSLSLPLEPAAQRTVSYKASSSGPASKAAITSTALIVQTPEGVVLQADRRCKPHPENVLINFVSQRGCNSVVRARVDEQGRQKHIKVETASGIPLAVIDTSSAVYDPQYDPPPQELRKAHIQRVTGRCFQLLGSPCATVVPKSSQILQVLSGDGRNSELLLTVMCDESGALQEMRSANGDFVVRQNTIGGDTDFWVAQGADITLVVCIALAVEKLQ